MKATESAGRLGETLPLVPLRDMVVFPHMMAPFVVGRESSIRALEAALATPTKRLFLAAQRDPQLDEPKPGDIFRTGVIATVAQSLKLPNGHIKVMVEGQRRGKIEGFEEHEEYMAVVVRPSEERPADAAELKEYMGKVLGLFEQYAKLSHHLAFETIAASLRIEEPERFADTLSAHLAVPTPEKQTLLESENVYEQLQKLQDLLEIEVEKVNIDRRINNKVKKQMEKAQKEYYLNEKIKAIHQELGRKDDRGDEVEELKKKIASAGMPKEVREKAESELKRLEAMPPVSAEATVSRNYIEWLVGVPWKQASRESKDISRAEKILNEDHYGLEKVKERILEFLAVRQLVQKTKGSIICFVGPPGVGKTSLAKSIARSLNRRFVRLSLGGVRDEAEIRGHRRTYIGAFPGQIIQMMKKAGRVNPVFLLDEVDKMSSDFRGDPASALLEVLDPEQNHSFLDHYLDVEYDLSKVMFICTANVLHTIPQPLQDRMEVLRLPGYTEQEKYQIAKRYLIPRQLEKTGVSKDNVQFTDEAITHVIRHYTHEAGVRNLDREIANVCRKVARKVVGEGKDFHAEITVANVNDYLGILKYRDFFAEKKNEIGLTTGLAWTEVGGSVLVTEAAIMQGKGRLTPTGKLGEVMQESAQAAMSYIRSRTHLFGLTKDFYRHLDIHVHVPEGAIPKDGPSAGITICTSIVSALTRIPVRCDVAMTGEITLRGKVLPIGGVKEKLLAAHRMGLRTIILPKDNEKDLADIPPEILAQMSINLVESMDEVLQFALEQPLPISGHPPVPGVEPEFGTDVAQDNELTN